MKPAIDLSVILPLARQNNDEGYAQEILKYPFGAYQARARQIGFVDREVVLDVGCGFGQWTLAFALQNERALGLELNAARLEIARTLAKEHQVENVTYLQGSALDLPVESESVDAVFCYGVFMFLDRHRALAEFKRVLRPGGELYVCTNAFGWWLRLFRKNLRRNVNVRNAALRAMVRGRFEGTPLGALPNSTSRRDATALLQREGWEKIEADFEGRLGFLEGVSPHPVYEPTVRGFDCVIEFKAQKPAPGKASEAEAELHRTVEHTQRQTSFEYLSGLKRYPQPRPVVDLVFNADHAAIRHALSAARAVDRIPALRRIFSELTRGKADRLEQVRAVLTFAQLHFFHHFAGQPTLHGRSVFDPIASLLIGSGRCGTSARFLVDLLLVNGFSARLLGLGAHTAAEVELGGRWALIDASLFPPGLWPTNAAGQPLSLEDTLEAPHLLDTWPSYANYHHEYISAFLTEYPETDKEIGHLLRAPILPSSGYFGAKYFSGRRPGTVLRHTKRLPVERWSDRPGFGWLDQLEQQDVPGPALAVRQRPGQIVDVRRDGQMLRWERPFIGEGVQELRYRLNVSPQSRGWSWSEIPVGCRFEVPGQSFLTSDEGLALDTLRAAGRWLSIRAEAADWPEPQVYYLPSREFDLEGL